MTKILHTYGLLGIYIYYMTSLTEPKSVNTYITIHLFVFGCSEALSRLAMGPPKVIPISISIIVHYAIKSTSEADFHKVAYMKEVNERYP